MSFKSEADNIVITWHICEGDGNCKIEEFQMSYDGKAPQKWFGCVEDRKQKEALYLSYLKGVKEELEGIKHRWEAARFVHRDSAALDINLRIAEINKTLEGE